MFIIFVRPPIQTPQLSVQILRAHGGRTSKFLAKALNFLHLASQQTRFTAAAPHVGSPPRVAIVRGYGFSSKRHSLSSLGTFVGDRRRPFRWSAVSFRISLLVDTSVVGIGSPGGCQGHTQQSEFLAV